MPGFFPSAACTVQEALTRFVDVSAIPRRGFVKSLGLRAADDLDRARLLDLAAMGPEVCVRVCIVSVSYAYMREWGL